MGAYAEAFNRSLADPDVFWREASWLVDWVKKPRAILDSSSAPFYRWFPKAELNTCYNALDRHVEAGLGEQIAVEYVSPVTGVEQSISYWDLWNDVTFFAGALRNLGVGRGDRVIIYMPMIPQTVVAMLACARLGAIHSVVFGGFAPAELAARIDDARPAVIVTASCGVEGGRVIPYKPLVDTALAMSAHKPRHTIVFQREVTEAELGPGDLDWDELVLAADQADWVPVRSTDPLYILYTSGTTGKPKGIVRDNGGHAVAMAWSFRNVFGMGPGRVWWSASDVGWVVGHSYIVYAPLISGATTVLYEGKPVGTPDAGAFWRIVEKFGVQGLFTAPTALRAIKKEDPNGELIREYDLRSLEAVFLAGERLDPGTYLWARDQLFLPVIDNWWQTETGWPIAANMRGLEPMRVKAGSPTVPVPGFDVQVLGADSAPVDTQVEGELAIRLPLPPGSMLTLWGDDQRFVSEYLTRHPGYYASGDGGYIDEDGYIFVMGRTDDVINVAGHRLTTGVMEAVVAGHRAVAECAVIGVPDELKGQVPRAFVVLKAGVEIDGDDLAADISAAIRSEIGPIASLKDVVIVPALPKTRSGKILRRTMRGIAAGRDEPVPSTIEDPAVLESLVAVLRG